MKTKTFFNILSVAGLLAAALLTWYLYTLHLAGELTSTLLWGSFPTLLFVVITSSVQLIRNRNRIRQ